MFIFTLSINNLREKAHPPCLNLEINLPATVWAVIRCSDHRFYQHNSQICLMPVIKIKLQNQKYSAALSFLSVWHSLYLFIDSHEAGWSSSSWSHCDPCHCRRSGPARGRLLTCTTLQHGRQSHSPARRDVWILADYHLLPSLKSSQHIEPEKTDGSNKDTHSTKWQKRDVRRRRSVKHLPERFSGWIPATVCICSPRCVESIPWPWCLEGQEGLSSSNRRTFNLKWAQISLGPMCSCQLVLRAGRWADVRLPSWTKMNLQQGLDPSLGHVHSETVFEAGSSCTNKRGSKSDSVTTVMFNQCGTFYIKYIHCLVWCFSRLSIRVTSGETNVSDILRIKGIISQE